MILMEDIIREGDPRLNQKAAVVDPITEDDVNLLKEMMEYVRNSVDEEIAEKYNLRPSVGLAAPQLGVLKRIIAISALDEEGELQEFALINPKIVAYSVDLTYLKGGEGCLSVDREVKGLVLRKRRITFTAYQLIDEKLEKVKIKLKGYLAVVFQHEYDHLDGILFPERIDKEKPFYVPNNAVPIEFEEEGNEEGTN